MVAGAGHHRQPSAEAGPRPGSHARPDRPARAPSPAPRQRLDVLVQLRGLAESRTQAQGLILAGRILVNGQACTKAGAQVSSEAELRRQGAPARFASRAGAKLEAALDHFGIQVGGRVALDVGSSTGGFTDCLLQRGARRVHAVDSGTNQMTWRLRQDARVHLRERTNARYLSAEEIAEPIELLTVDVSFISVRTLLPALTPLLAPGAEAVILIKPQFEAGREGVGKGGIVRDPSVRAAAVEAVGAAARESGLEPVGVIPSPVLGAEGNQEYLMYARRPEARP